MNQHESFVHERLLDRYRIDVQFKHERENALDLMNALKITYQHKYDDHLLSDDMM